MSSEPNRELCRNKKIRSIGSLCFAHTTGSYPNNERKQVELESENGASDTYRQDKVCENGLSYTAVCQGTLLHRLPARQHLAGD